MTSAVVRLFKEASELNEGDRAALAGLLLESLDLPPDPSVDSAWAEEVARRCREIDEGAVETVSWEEVKASLLEDEHADRNRR